MIRKICVRCGTEFLTNRNNAKYCDEECKRKAAREVFRKARIKAKKEKAHLEPLPWPDDRKCKRCRFSMYLQGHYLCDYLSITGHMRGCEYGKNCEKFDEKRRIRRASEEIFERQEIKY